jgi:hypothetical protein
LHGQQPSLQRRGEVGDQAELCHLLDRACDMAAYIRGDS